MRAGIQASATTGVVNGGSRIGVRGTSEVSEGLTAVYQFEHSLDITTGDWIAGGGRGTYIGLSGGFGTLTMGEVGAASGNNFGALTDNSTFLGSSGVTSRLSHAISYAVSVENISMQIDAGMNNGGGERATAIKPEDKNVDQVEFGASMGLGENAKIAFAHISHDTVDKAKKKGTFLGGEYSIGNMTMHLGVGRTKENDSSKIGDDSPGTVTLDGDQLGDYVEHKQTDSTTFAGFRGSLGDTGVSFVFQAKRTKSKGTHGGIAYDMATATDGVQSGDPVPTNSRSAWLLALSRSLGGGASVHFEHDDQDDGTKSTSYLALKVDF